MNASSSLAYRLAQPVLSSVEGLSMTQKWNSWWLRKAPPHAISILRILFGLWMLLYFGLRIPHVAMLFSNEGLTIPYDFTIHYGSLPFIEFIQSILTPQSPEVAYALFLLHIAALLSFTLGAFTRTSALLVFLFYLYEMNLSYHHMGTSYNRLFLFFSFLFIFAQAGKTFSWDMKRKHGSILAWEPISIFFQRIIALQISATYLGVGMQKLWLPDWESGSMLLLSFQNMWATPLAFWVASKNLPMWIYDGMVMIVKAFEIAHPFGLWSKKWRLWFMAGGILFHLGVSLFLSAIWWFYAMIACYITFFEPEEVYERMRAWFPRIPSAASSSRA